VIRRARRVDLPELVALLADDPLGAGREVPDLWPYEDAFEAIGADPNQVLVCAEDAGEVVGTLQLTVVPGLSRGGMPRGQIEAVRVRADRRGHGLGRTLVEWAVGEARRRGCGLVQLTTDRSRRDALGFYTRLGFVDSHHGLKLGL
jgi:ribosomal protein S18 acetylase RimI-like enzyme